MYDFNVFEQARRQYSIPNLPFLDSQREKAFIEKPYQGLKILHNIPLTLITVFKIENLALGGAEVVATSIKMLPPEERAINLLKKANFKVQIEHNFDEEFDFHLDCCGELLSFTPPKIGAVELTQTGSQLYKNVSLNYPMVSIDDSKLKLLETFFGTGDAFCRAVYQFAGSEMRDKHFVLFGYGKVGKGILYALRKWTNNITVIDIESNPSRFPTDIDYISAADKSLVKQVIANAWCTVTATGIKNLMTEYFGLKKEDFGTSLLTNMGAEDEYGDNFDLGNIMFDKKPFNFSLDQPTALHYLDPVFYSHNAAIDLILSKKMGNGYNPYPESDSNGIIEKWQSIYHESIDHALIK